MFVDNGYKEVDGAWRFVISTEKDCVVLVVFNFKRYINISDCAARFANHIPVTTTLITFGKVPGPNATPRLAILI